MPEENWITHGGIPACDLCHTRKVSCAFPLTIHAEWHTKNDKGQMRPQGTLHELHCSQDGMSSKQAQACTKTQSPNVCCHLNIFPINLASSLHKACTCRSNPSTTDDPSKLAIGMRRYKLSYSGSQTSNNPYAPLTEVKALFQSRMP
jgi:hypothetical protein